MLKIHTFPKRKRKKNKLLGLKHAWAQHENSEHLSHRELRSLLHDLVAEHRGCYRSLLPSQCLWWCVWPDAAGILDRGLNSVHPCPRYRTLTWSNEATPIHTSPQTVFYCTFSRRRPWTAGCAAHARWPFGPPGTGAAWKSSIDGHRHWHKRRGH